MSSLETGPPALGQIEVVTTIWDRLRTHLEHKKAGIYQEMGSYPSPIAACDQQFTYLLEEQTRVSRELVRLNESASTSQTLEDPLRLIDDFIRSSSYVDAELEQAVRAYLEEGLLDPKLIKAEEEL